MFVETLNPPSKPIEVPQLVLMNSIMSEHMGMDWCGSLESRIKRDEENGVKSLSHHRISLMKILSLYNMLIGMVGYTESLYKEDTIISNPIRANEFMKTVESCISKLDPDCRDKYLQMEYIKLLKSSLNFKFSNIQKSYFLRADNFMRLIKQVGGKNNIITSQVIFLIKEIQKLKYFSLAASFYHKNMPEIENMLMKYGKNCDYLRPSKEMIRSKPEDLEGVSVANNMIQNNQTNPLVYPEEENLNKTIMNDDFVKKLLEISGENADGLSALDSHFAFFDRTPNNLNLETNVDEQMKEEQLPFNAMDEILTYKKSIGTELPDLIKSIRDKKTKQEEEEDFTQKLDQEVNEESDESSDKSSVNSSKAITFHISLQDELEDDDNLINKRLNNDDELEFQDFPTKKTSL